MKTTLILKDEIIKEAQRLTQVKEKTALVHMGLKLLIEKQARLRLAALGGTQNCDERLASSHH